ncbi:MAG TPA: efflux RND transporter periplasmic adaptor subunit [Planctomycetaceae bacterium]|nr:efflux RND transporter periplasmic adaptor subunit [Planctomycetaceae bacterium]
MIVGWLLFALTGCGDEKETPRPPTNVAQPAGIVTLSQKGVGQLGIECQRPAKRDVQALMSLTGWLELPPGKQIVVKSPLTGYLAENQEQAAWALGARVKRQQTLQRLMAFLSPTELAQLVAAKEETDIAIEQSLVSMKLAEEQLAKASAARDAVLGTRLNDLKEIFGRSKAAYEESKEKLKFLPREPYEGDLLMRPVTIESPLSGRIVTVHVTEPQFVFQGDPLWTIADWSALWVRVPVFETDLPRVLTTAAIGVRIPGSSAVAATPLETPQPTKPGLRTVDLLYSLPNAGETLRPGQSVLVDLPAGASEERLLIARSAVLWDGHGGAWVYVRASEDSFRRQRVELGQTVGEEVVIARGLDDDDEVVTTAAQSLYGEEFKGALPADDD